MADVKILIKGYTNVGKPGKKETVCPTITLIKDQNLKIIVDPGTLKNQNILIRALKNQGLQPKNINIVFLTHSHIDHFRNTGMFPNAKVIEYYGIWHKDIIEKLPAQITKNIKIIKTPGHSYTGLTLLVKTKIGKIAICGDVFWKKDYPKNDSFADNPKLLKQSRRKLLKIADYIIPGHDGMYIANLKKKRVIP